MALTRAEILTRVKTALAADLSTPLTPHIADESITEWANQCTSEVIMQIEDASQYQRLKYPNYALTFSSGVASLPSDFVKELVVKTGASDIMAEKLDDEAFARWDSSNFLLTPITTYPLVKFTNNQVFVKPTSITAGKLDYIKKHPTISASQASVFGDIGDNLLIKLILEKCYDFLEREPS